MLTYNPKTRITAMTALNHPWFKEFQGSPVEDSIANSGDIVESLSNFHVVIL